MGSAQGESGEESRSRPDRSGDLADEALGEPGTPADDEGVGVEHAGPGVQADVVRREPGDLLPDAAAAVVREERLSGDDRHAQDRDRGLVPSAPSVPTCHAEVPPSGYGAGPPTTMRSPQTPPGRTPGGTQLSSLREASVTLQEGLETRAHRLSLASHAY